MKFRIIPCIGNKIYYKIQIKSFLFWRDEVEVSDYGYGSVAHKEVFPTIKSAKDFAKSKYGSNAKYICFEIK